MIAIKINGFTGETFDKLKYYQLLEFFHTIDGVHLSLNIKRFLIILRPVDD